MKNKKIITNTLTIRYPKDMDADIMSILEKSMQMHGCAVSRNKLVNAALRLGLPLLAKTFDCEEKEMSKND